MGHPPPGARTCVLSCARPYTRASRQSLLTPKCRWGSGTLLTLGHKGLGSALLGGPGGGAAQPSMPRLWVGALLGAWPFAGCGHNQDTVESSVPIHMSPRRRQRKLVGYAREGKPQELWAMSRRWFAKSKLHFAGCFCGTLSRPRPAWLLHPPAVIVVLFLGRA